MSKKIGCCSLTFLGYFAIPATSAWPYGLLDVPSSKFLTMTAFLPAYLPCRRTTTLLAFRNFTMVTAPVPAPRCKERGRSDGEGPASPSSDGDPDGSSETFFRTGLVAEKCDESPGTRRLEPTVPGTVLLVLLVRTLSTSRPELRPRNLKTGT